MIANPSIPDKEAKAMRNITEEPSNNVLPGKNKILWKKIKSVNIGALFEIKTYHLSEGEWSQN